MFKLNNKNTRTTSMTSFQCFYVNFEYISHLFVVFLLLNLSKENVCQARSHLHPFTCFLLKLLKSCFIRLDYIFPKQHIFRLFIHYLLNWKLKYQIVNVIIVEYMYLSRTLQFSIISSYGQQTYHLNIQKKFICSLGILQYREQRSLEISQ